MDNETEVQETDGFQNAMTAFAEEDQAGPPDAAIEGAVATPPTPPELPAVPEVPEVPGQAADVEPPKKPDDFVEFTTPEQKERFNKVFGYAKRLERELQTLQRAQPVVPQPVAPAAEPQQFSAARPNLADFETADQWGIAVADWAASKAESGAVNRSRQEYARAESERREQEQQAQSLDFLHRRTNEGYQKFGKMAFDNVCDDLVNFAPPDSFMNHTLFRLGRYSEVVMELGKNLPEADRISRLAPDDLIYELKTLEKKLIAREELVRKAQTKLPPKVEAPGQGEEPKVSPNLTKLKHAAYASGSLQDIAKIFEADQTL